MVLETKKINPLLLRAVYFDGYQLDEKKLSEREVFDYEIEFFIKSDGGIEIDGEFHEFSKGEINFRVPGQIVKGILPYSCYLLCIDIKGENTKKVEGYILGNHDCKQDRYENNILNGISTHINASNEPEIHQIIKQIYKENMIRNDENELRIKSLLFTLIEKLYIVSGNAEKHNIHVKKSLKIIEDVLFDDFKIEDIANKLGISTNYFQNIFKETIGISPKRYINQKRIEHAKYLLAITDMPIHSVGENCGFLDNVYFSYVFKNLTSMTPKKYRMSNKEFFY